MLRPLSLSLSLSQGFCDCDDTCSCMRASLSPMSYVPNAKYLAHLAHQTPFDPVYQMCHISYFL